MNPRSEPLLWLQLIGLGALPLQALLLLLLLAGSDPGRLPGLERLFTWAIGALLPGLLLLRRPADPFSLLLVSTPLRARRELQRRMATLQGALAPKVGLGLGIAGALALLVWTDEHAALAAALSPLASSPRLVGLLLAALLLAVMVWQWQQAIQALWLLSRPAAAVAAATAMPTADIGDQRLCIGLPLLLPDPLKLPEPPAADPIPEPAPAADPAPEPTAASVVEPVFDPEVEPDAEAGQGSEVDEDAEPIGEATGEPITVSEGEEVVEDEDPEPDAEAQDVDAMEPVQAAQTVEPDENLPPGEAVVEAVVGVEVEAVAEVDNEAEPPA